MSLMVANSENKFESLKISRSLTCIVEQNIEEGCREKDDSTVTEDKPAKNSKLSVGSIQAVVRKTVGSATSRKKEGDSEPKVCFYSDLTYTALCHLTRVVSDYSYLTKFIKFCNIV